MRKRSLNYLTMPIQFRTSPGQLFYDLLPVVPQIGRIVAFGQLMQVPIGTPKAFANVAFPDGESTKCAGELLSASSVARHF